MTFWRRCATVALVLAAPLLAACDPPLTDDSTDVELGDLALTIAVPSTYEIVDSAIGAPGCVDDAVVISVDTPGNVILATASPATACPDEQPLNGRFPSWGAVDQLPDGTTAATTGIDGATAYRFEVTYTECTNSCEDFDRQVTFVELDDGRTFFVVGRETADYRYEEMVSSITLTG